MRIAVDARPLAYPMNGIGRYLTKLLHLGTQFEHEWRLYSDRPIRFDAAMDRVRIRHGTITSGSIGTAYAQLRFPVWARRDDVDLFWSPRHHTPLLLGSIPSAVTIHDMVWRKVPETMIRLGRLAESLLMPAAIRHANLILVPSHATAEDIAAFYPDAARKVRVIPLAPSLVPPAACTTAAESPPYLLFVGTLEPRKNLGRVIDSYCRLIENEAYPHNLLIVGSSGWKNADVMGRLHRASASDRVRYLGHVDDSRLAKLYAGADFVVAPSLYEGFGLQILEAFRFGKPVITSNVSSMPEVAGDAAILVDPYSVEAITEAMHRLIEDRALHSDLSRRALARSMMFSWEQTAEATLAALAECCRR